MAIDVKIPASSVSNSWRYKLRNRVIVPLRTLTSGFRARPDFIIAGVQKGGTTPYWRYLTEHPQVMRGLVKESHYFDRHYARGERWYRSLFPLSTKRRAQEAASGGPVRVMDAVPDYVYDPRSAERIARDLPEARSVILLRNPVDRAYSHYQMMVARDYETLSFADAIAAEEERTKGEWEKIEADPTYISHPLRVYSYLSRGLYADQLERWFAHIPREQTLVLRSEDARENPERVYRELTDFLEIEPFRPPSFAPKNTRDYTPLDATLRAELDAYFAPQTRQVEALLGRKMGWQ